MKESFPIISAVNEALALSNDPQQLLEMVLDTLVEVLGVECCWVQLLDPESRRLRMAARRGLTPEMEFEVAPSGTGTDFSGQVLGSGYKVVIPDLSRDKEYSLTSFAGAGLRSLVAVPLETYHAQGVMGVASSRKKRFNEEAAELFSVIAGMVGTALDKAEIYQRTLSSAAVEDEVDPAPTYGLEETEIAAPDGDPAAVSVPESIFSNYRLRMNPSDLEASLDGRLVSLTSAEYRLLSRLASNEGRVVPYEELLIEGWGNDYLEAMPLIRMNVQHLKQKLVDGVTPPAVVIDEIGGGYRFICRL